MILDSPRIGDRDYEPDLRAALELFLNDRAQLVKKVAGLEDALSRVDDCHRLAECPDCNPYIEKFLGSA